VRPSSAITNATCTILHHVVVIEPRKFEDEYARHVCQIGCLKNRILTIFAPYALSHSQVKITVAATGRCVSSYPWQLTNLCSAANTKSAKATVSRCHTVRMQQPYMITSSALANCTGSMVCAYHPLDERDRLRARLIVKWEEPTLCQ